MADEPRKDVHLSEPASEPWQLTLGRYAIQQAPTIIAAIFLGVGGCYAAGQIKQGQMVTHEILEDHTVKIDKAADAAAVVKEKLEKKEGKEP